MKKLSKILASVVISSLIATLASGADVQKDPETGFIIAPGFEEVKANCTVCHTSKFVIAQKGNKDAWKQMIVWMQKTQGLWEFDKETEEKILTYLSTNYPAVEGGRRAPIPPALMPPTK